MAKGDYLGEFEIYVMLAITGLADDAYGITIRRAIQDRTGREVAIGAVYATLGRLEDKGLVRHAVSAPDPVPGGRSRKIFRLTAAGDRALAQATTMLARMMAGVIPAPARGRTR
jgi:PadR family transcriptional regulator, regulatory protein PadR